MANHLKIKNDIFTMGTNIKLIGSGWALKRDGR